MGNSFYITPEVIRDFPETHIRFVVARNLRNAEPWDNLEESLGALAAQLSSGEWEPFEETSPVISSWHDAYRRFGTNPRRSRPSLDALSRRLRRDGKLPRINPAVDAYNLVSITRGTPAGAFDMDKLAERVTIRFTEPDDSFTPLGEPEEAEQPKQGEVVYAQGSQVLTRSWNHRDSDQTKVTETSRNVVFILERISQAAVSDRQMADAQEMLAGLIEPHAESLVLAVIEPKTPEVNLADG
jgi:DNA/RNA-binding domain of Phe-tRNA-synthetase-like protein